MKINDIFKALSHNTTILNQVQNSKSSDTNTFGKQQDSLKNIKFNNNDKKQNASSGLLKQAIADKKSNSSSNENSHLDEMSSLTENENLENQIGKYLNKNSDSENYSLNQHNLDGVKKRGRKAKAKFVSASMIADSIMNNLVTVKNSSNSVNHAEEAVSNENEESNEDYLKFEEDDQEDQNNNNQNDDDDDFQYNDEDEPYNEEFPLDDENNDDHPHFDKENMDENFDFDVKKRKTVANLATTTTTTTKKVILTEKPANHNSLNKALAEKLKKSERKDDLQIKLEELVAATAVANAALQMNNNKEKKRAKSMLLPADINQLVAALSQANAQQQQQLQNGDEVKVKRGPGRPPKIVKPEMKISDDPNMSILSLLPLLTSMQQQSNQALSSGQPSPLVSQQTSESVKNNAASVACSNVSASSEKPASENKNSKKANLSKILETVANKKNISIDEKQQQQQNDSSTNLNLSQVESMTTNQSEEATTLVPMPTTENCTSAKKHHKTDAAPLTPSSNTKSANKTLIDSIKQDNQKILAEAALQNSTTNTTTTTNAENENTAQLTTPLNFKDVKKSVYTSLLKLTYLNACDQINDQVYDFMFESLLPNKSLARILTKSAMLKLIADYSDAKLHKQVGYSPLYSLIIQCSPDLNTLYIYIKYLNHTALKNEVAKNLQEMHLIKVLDLSGPMKTFKNNEIKLAKFLFEQLKLNVIQSYRLNKQNLMCLSIDNNLLDTLCFSTLQLYLNDLFNTFILIVPNFEIGTTLARELNAWSFNQESFKTFFSTCYDLSEFFKQKAMTEGIALFQHYLSKIGSHDFVLDLSTMQDYLQLTETIYVNYSRFVTEMEMEKREVYASLKAKLTSIEFYFMTCLLCDLFKFLISLMENLKNANNFTQFSLAWSETPGSYLHNLLNVQLVTEGSIHISFQSTPMKGFKATIEADSDRIENLKQFEKSMQSIVFKVLDLSSDLYREKIKNYELSFLSSGSEAEKSGKPLHIMEIYRTLYEMFDISFGLVENKNGKMLFSHALCDQNLENLLQFYEFANIVEVDRLKSEYKQFFETFFEKLSSEEKTIVLTRKEQSLFSLENQSFGSIKEKFVRYVYENNRVKYVPVVSFMATNYLCLPSVLSLNQLVRGESELAAKNLADVEIKLKLLNSVQSPFAIDLDANCGVSLEEMPLIDLFN